MIDLPFDLKLNYQFGFIFKQTTNLASRDLAEMFVGRFSKYADSAPALRLKKQKEGFSIASKGSQFQNKPIYNWATLGNIWTVTVGPERLDVTFNALAYHEIAESFLDFSKVFNRLKPIFSEIVNNLPITIFRPLVVVTVEDTCVNSNSTFLVLKQFYNQEYLSRKDEVLDVRGRINIPIDVEIGNQEQNNNHIVRLNRIEQGSSIWFVENHQPKTILQWQWDVNTNPLGTTSFDEEKLSSFYKEAMNWIGERYQGLSEAVQLHEANKESPTN